MFKGVDLQITILDKGRLKISVYYRTKRWQRRWFVLYDDGELTYSVDDHPETIPQVEPGFPNLRGILETN